MGSVAASSLGDDDRSSSDGLVPRLCCLCKEANGQRANVELLADIEQQMAVQPLADSVRVADPSSGASPTTLGLGAASLLEGATLNLAAVDGESQVSSPSAKKGLEENQVSVSRSEVQERARLSKKQSPMLEHPDFNGTWKMVACEGDFDSFMKEMGVAWALRKAAQAVNYGVGSTFHTVEHDSDRIKIETKNPKGTFTKDLKIDGSEQDDIDPIEKKALKVVPYWETVENSLVLTVEAFMPVTSGDPRKFPLTRRYMREHCMIVEQVSPTGVKVTRVFHKQ